MVKINIMKLFYLFAILILVQFGSFHPICTENKKCSYRLSRLNENEYLMVKNIMQNLIKSHWNITSEYLNALLDASSRFCDQYFDYVAVNQAKSKDFRHPNALFKNLSPNQINKTIALEYEKEWYEKFKLIRYDLQSEKYLDQCNNIGLKIYFLIYDYSREQSKIFKCSSKSYLEEPVTSLIDYYIAWNLFC